MENPRTQKKDSFYSIYTFKIQYMRSYSRSVHQCWCRGYFLGQPDAGKKTGASSDLKLDPASKVADEAEKKE